MLGRNCDVCITFPAVSCPQEDQRENNSHNHLDSLQEVLRNLQERSEWVLRGFLLGSIAAPRPRAPIPLASASGNPLPRDRPDSPRSATQRTSCTEAPAAHALLAPQLGPVSRESPFDSSFKSRRKRHGDKALFQFLVSWTIFFAHMSDM